MKWLPMLLIAAISPNVLAWGPSGHRIVCQIAWQLLLPSVREQIDAAAERAGYQTFAQSCVWADSIRSDPRFESLKSLHYVNVPKPVSRVNRGRDCPGTDEPSCVLTAIDYYQQRWRNPALHQQQRDQALLLLGHFVGDIHQPMHVSYQFDRGGNRQMVTWINNEKLSLHELWDNDIIDCKSKLSWHKLTHQLYAEITQQQRQQWQIVGTDQSGSIDQWADESLKLTREIYTYVDRPLKPLDYCQHFTPMARQRLQMAGVRLASLIQD
jgi:S1/P1 Nuclease